MKFIKSILLFFVFQLILNQASACSCEYYKSMDLRQYNGYDLVYKGEVLSVIEKREQWEKVIEFSIKKVYRGQIESEMVSVRTRLDGASCGLDFKVGQTWVIFSSGGKRSNYTGLCSRSRLLNGNPAKYLKFIADKKFVNKYSSYSGTVSYKDVKGKFSNGKAVGKWTYFQEGKVWEVRRYSDNGVLHGISEVYYEDGPLHYITEYENGEYVRSAYYKKDGTIDRVFEK